MYLPEVDKYAHLPSLVHEWDGRLRIVSLAVLAVSIATLTSLGAGLVALAIALILVYISRIPIGFVLRRLRWVLMFVGVLFAVLLFTVRGTPVVDFGIVISREGVELGALVLVRALSITLLMIPMFGTSAFHESLKAFEQLGVPPKLVQLVLFTYRYLFLFSEESRRILVAARSRGWAAKMTLSGISMAGNIVGMLLVRSFERTERVHSAMLSRGYEGRVAMIGEFKLHARDWLKGLLVVAAAGGLQLIGRL